MTHGGGPTAARTIMKHTIIFPSVLLFPCFLILLAAIGSIVPPERAEAIDINTEQALLDGNWMRVRDLIHRDETIYDPVRVFIFLQTCIALDQPCAPIFSGLAWEPWGPPRAACRYASALTARNPGNPNALYLMAASLATSEELERAHALYSEAIRYDSNMAHAYLGRGVLNYRLSNTEAALADLAEVLKIFPGHTAAHLNRALIYSDEGETEKALADIDSTAYLEGHRSRAFLLRGGIFAQLNEPDSAIEYYSRALEEDDLIAQELVYFYRAKEYIKIGKFKKAREDFEEFVSEDRLKELEAHRQAKRSLKVFERIDRPWEYAEKLREGMLLTEFGHYDSAAATLSEALAEEPNEVITLFYRSKALAGL